MIVALVSLEVGKRPKTAQTGRRLIKREACSLQATIRTGDALAGLSIVKAVSRPQVDLNARSRDLEYRATHSLDNDRKDRHGSGRDHGEELHLHGQHTLHGAVPAVRVLLD